MQRRTRNRICIGIIFGGLLNFLAYTIIYASVGGDARNGGKDVETLSGRVQEVFYIRGHFIHGPKGQERSVPKWVWIYSYLHSISLWPTQGAVVICMLILAQPLIIATMAESYWIRGPTFIPVVITLTAVVCSAFTVWFTIDFVRDLSQAI